MAGTTTVIAVKREERRRISMESTVTITNITVTSRNTITTIIDKIKDDRIFISINLLLSNNNILCL